MFAISVGAHSCAMNSRLKAAPTITLSEREMLGCSFGYEPNFKKLQSHWVLTGELQVSRKIKKLKPKSVGGNIL
jgi:hypothetical protein